MNRRTGVTRRRIFLSTGAMLLLLSGPTGLEGQRGGGSDAPPEASSRSWWTVWSTASPHDRIFLGMWTLHPFEGDPYPRTNNEGLGLQYRGFFGFTCVNSFERRTYALGIERVWAEALRRPLGLMLGFRIGLISGYDTRLFRVAGETPVLPFFGTVALVRIGPVGGEVSWVYRAVSLVGAVFF